MGVSWKNLSGGALTYRTRLHHLVVLYHIATNHDTPAGRFLFVGLPRSCLISLRSATLYLALHFLVGCVFWIPQAAGPFLSAPCSTPAWRCGRPDLDYQVAAIASWCQVAIVFANMHDPVPVLGLIWPGRSRSPLSTSRFRYFRPHGICPSTLLKLVPTSRHG